MNRPLELSEVSSPEEKLTMLNNQIQAYGTWHESVRSLKHVVGIGVISLILTAHPVPKLNTVQIAPKNYDESSINLLDKSLSKKTIFERDVRILEEQINIIRALEDEEAQSEQRILNSYMNVMNEFYNSNGKEFIL